MNFSVFNTLRPPKLVWLENDILIDFAFCTGGFVHSYPKKGPLNLVDVIECARGAMRGAMW